MNLCARYLKVFSPIALTHIMTRIRCFMQSLCTPRRDGRRPATRKRDGVGEWRACRGLPGRIPVWPFSRRSRLVTWSLSSPNRLRSSTPLAEDGACRRARVSPYLQGGWQSGCEVLRERFPGRNRLQAECVNSRRVRNRRRGERYRLRPGSPRTAPRSASRVRPLGSPGGEPSPGKCRLTCWRAVRSSPRRG